MKPFKLIIFFIAILYSYKTSGQLILAQWDFPNNPDNANVDLFTPSNANSKLICNAIGTVKYNLPGNTTNCASDTGWQNGNGVRYWSVDLNTTGQTNITVSLLLKSTLNGPRDFRMDYKIGSGGWTIISGGTIKADTNFINGALSNFLLPVICENKASLRLRWIMNSNTSVSGGNVLNSGISYIDDISIQSNFGGYFRSVSSGDWSQPSTWQVSTDSIGWGATVYTPTNFAKTISIENGNTVNINSFVKIDETIVQAGAALKYSSGRLVIANGSACDLNIMGTFYDSSATGIAFDTLATYQLGVNATYIKSGAGSALPWQINYDNGIQNIPATANWILRRTNVLVNPPLATITGTTQPVYYPNLYIENALPSYWNINVNTASAFNGSNTGYPTIKGNLDIGGNGIGTLNFSNRQVSSNPTKIFGNLIIRTGNSLQNDGTGIELQGDLDADGTIFYSNLRTPKISFTGINQQFINGTGKIQIYDMILQKSVGNVILNKSILIDHNITFNGGQIISKPDSIVIIDSLATATILNNTSYVNGPVRKIGYQAFTFPIGKSYLQTLGVDDGGKNNDFWIEKFENFCASGCNADGYSSQNGTWTVNNLSNPGPLANKFYVSYSENGTLAGNCSSSGGGDATLHVGQDINANCPNGDCGANYNFGDLLLSSATNIRAESPTIDCTNKRELTISFNYFEGGLNNADDASLWYFDGSSWSMIFNLAKTSNSCGTDIGLWTAFSYKLPASAANNPNVKIGFSWKNNNDGLGTGTSFAVDYIRISEGLSLTVEYFDTDPAIEFNNNLEPTFDNLSTCGYWMVNQDAGLSNKTITVSYNNSMCYTTVPVSMIVAAFDTNQAANIWRDYGQSASAGSFSAGTITAAKPAAYYGPVAIGYLINPLPLQLTFFEAKAKNKKGYLNWQTSVETDLNFFIVEKSKDLNTITELYRINHLGNNLIGHYYNVIDQNPFDGITYYRLKMVDNNGKVSYSAWKSIDITDAQVHLVLNNDTQTNQLVFTVVNAQDQIANFSVIDVTGKKIIEGIAHLNSINKVDLYGLSAGVYMINLSNSEYSFIDKFIVK